MENKKQSKEKKLPEFTVLEMMLVLQHSLEDIGRVIQNQQNYIARFYLFGKEAVESPDIYYPLLKNEDDETIQELQQAVLNNINFAKRINSALDYLRSKDDAEFIEHIISFITKEPDCGTKK